ncbi:MAG TPA: AAA family ATPase, partial [Thermomicrobiales bacterium]|nr:AAA family ATPase [Thermomicrobiales bacterium]
MSARTPGERIRHIRTTLGLTQIAFGALLGVSNVTVNRWENDRAQPQPATLARIYQAERDGLAALEPETRIVAAPSTLIGRDHTLTTLTDALRPGGLITITGPAGVGKSTLAQAAIRQIGTRFPGGMTVIDCAPITSSAMLIETIARACHIRLGNEINPAARVASALRNRNALLVLDAAEHQIESIRDLLTLIRSEPTSLTILVTSRFNLGLAEEQIIPVAPLDPESAQRLFLDHGSGTIKATTAEIALLCTRLDHLPLAIELAASRTRILTVTQMLERIDRRFDVLGPLATSIASSCDLMTATEASLFRRASLFVGPFDLAALEAMAPDPETIAALAGLIDQSMLTVEADTGVIRYRMLESIRDFGWNWAADLGELSDLRTAHAGWFDHLLTTAIHDFNGQHEPAALTTIDGAHDNIAAALHWVLASGQTERALRMATNFGRFARRRGIPAAGIGWLEQALGLPEAADQPGSLTATNELGLLAVALGRMDQAELAFHRVIARAMATGDDLEAGRAWDNLGLVHRSRGETEAARAAHQSGLDLLQDLGDARGASSCRLNLALIANLTGDLE